MATLSLKKAKPIGDTLLDNLLGKFVVMRQARHEKSFRFTCYHETQDLAEREADRLCSKNKTERYLVLQVVSSVEWEEV
jgi:hypothetical protein